MGAERGSGTPHNQQQRPKKMTITSNGSTAPEILQAAIAEMADRAATYDKPEGERSMAATVEAFKAVTGHDLTETQGWLFMALLKAVRSQQGAYRADSYVDGAAYFGLAGEAAAREETENAELCQMVREAHGNPTIPGEVEWPTDERMNNIGPNGNDGLHYPTVESWLGPFNLAKGATKEIEIDLNFPEGTYRIGDTPSFEESANFDPVPANMDDPRNWRAGDLVECVTELKKPRLSSGEVCTLIDTPFNGSVDMLVGPDQESWMMRTRNFRFHSRPSKINESEMSGAWIAWSGGECPCDEKSFVEIERKSGIKVQSGAGSFDWFHVNVPSDIIRYRML